MNPIELRQKKEILQKQMDELTDQLDLINNAIEAESVKDILTLIKGTRWFIPRSRYSSNLMLDTEDETSQAFKKYVLDNLGLYPHGQHFITDSIGVFCDDGDIGLRIDCMINKVLKNPLDNPIFLLVPFVKEHGLIIDFSDALLELKQKEESIKEHKENLDLIIKAFS